MTTLFGVMTIATAFVNNKKELIVTRVFLGIAEGGTLVGSCIPFSFNPLSAIAAWSYVHHVPRM